MTAAERLAELEAERWAPVPRRVKPAGPKPVTEAEAARNRAVLLGAVSNRRVKNRVDMARDDESWTPSSALRDAA